MSLNYLITCHNDIFEVGQIFKKIVTDINLIDQLACN